MSKALSFAEWSRLFRKINLFGLDFETAKCEIITMKRHIECWIKEHFAECRQMLFVSGPRQVGKTTSAKSALKNAVYLNWDIADDRQLLLAGQNAVAEKLGVSDNPAIIIDEFHKYPEWKNYLKGLFDALESEHVKILITGSARLDTYRKGADSLMGRYFIQHIHPLSVAEIIRPRCIDTLTTEQAKITPENFNNLLVYGGFPEPFTSQTKRFHTRWKNVRQKQLFREELRDLFNVHEIGQIEVLAELLRMQNGQLCNYASLARKVRASENSIRRWISILESLYFCYSLKPWSKNISRSLCKEPKIYLWDWSVDANIGSRNENFIASHLFKAVHAWNDAGHGDFGLYFLRTKDKREVDFIVTHDNQPWFMVEAKTSDTVISKHLKYFHERLDCKHAFQVVIKKEFENVDSFSFSRPIAISALNFLSQLV